MSNEQTPKAYTALLLQTTKLTSCFMLSFNVWLDAVDMKLISIFKSLCNKRNEIYPLSLSLSECIIAFKSARTKFIINASSCYCATPINYCFIDSETYQRPYSTLLSNNPRPWAQQFQLFDLMHALLFKKKPNGLFRWPNI